MSRATQGIAALIVWLALALAMTGPSMAAASYETGAKARVATIELARLGGADHDDKNSLCHGDCVQCASGCGIHVGFATPNRFIADVIIPTDWPTPPSTGAPSPWLAQLPYRPPCTHA